jgi:hypothetical protein
MKGVTLLDASEMERIIDRLGLHRALSLIETICAEKANHVRSSYNDPSGALRWNKAAIKVSSCAAKVDAIFHGEG